MNFGPSNRRWCCNKLMLENSPKSERFFRGYQSPEGRTENSPGLQAWEGLRKENRPERAADLRALFSRDNLRQKRLDGTSETTNLFWYKNLRAQLVGAKETGPIKCNNNISLHCRPIPLFGRPFRAISLWVSFPGLKPWAILSSPFWRLVPNRRSARLRTEGLIAE